MTGELPRIVLFNINGSGLGHLSRCLAYARRMQGRARPIFFSLASAVEIIEEMGFEADYFVSEFWSRSHINAWNRELAIRFGLVLEEIRPQAVLFDGSWPFHGFMHACDQYGVGARIWSNRGLYKENSETIPIEETEFDLVIEPGEIGSELIVERPDGPGRKVTTPPVTLLDRDELLFRHEARIKLGLNSDGRYVLMSLGPGNLKDVGDIGLALIHEFRSKGYDVVWARTPITVNDIPLPDDVIPVSKFPLVRYMHAFDAFVSAAGYNACCEIVQSGIPSLIVPNLQVADDQVVRAELASAYGPVVISACDTQVQRLDAVSRLLEISTSPDRPQGADLPGAAIAVDEIISLVGEKGMR
jgi:UDP:flavonoid glycosyltransferase YjiC (YdhE family)